MTQNNNTIVYKANIAYNAGVILTVAAANNSYAVGATIVNLSATVISDPKQIDANPLDYNFNENLNNILGFMQRYANKVILAEGLSFANPLQRLFLIPTLKVMDGALYGFFGVNF